MTWITLAAALALAAVHVFSQVFRILKAVPRSRFLSIAGGTASAFVILQLLPALAVRQEILQQATAGTSLSFLQRHVYILVLISLLLFYGMERLANASRPKEDDNPFNQPKKAPPAVFWLNMGSFALMNILIGTLLQDQAKRSQTALLFFWLAMMFKFIVTDHSLHMNFEALYDNVGRWVLAAAVMVGWTLNTFIQLPPTVPALLQGFLAGGVLLNVLKEELPRERQSRYWAFALGALVYGALLLLF